MRKFAAWYAIGLGVALVAAPFVALELDWRRHAAHSIITVAFVIAGVLLTGGGLGQLMRVPGRSASYFLGAGAAGFALLVAIATVVESGGPIALWAGFSVALVVLVVGSWSYWPRS